MTVLSASWNFGKASLFFLKRNPSLFCPKRSCRSFKRKTAITSSTFFQQQKIHGVLWLHLLISTSLASSSPKNFWILGRVFFFGHRPQASYSGWFPLLVTWSDPTCVGRVQELQRRKGRLKTSLLALPVAKCTKDTELPGDISVGGWSSWTRHYLEDLFKGWPWINQVLLDNPCRNGNVFK